MKLEKGLIKIIALIAIGLLIGFGCAKKQISQETSGTPTSTTSSQQSTSQGTTSSQSTSTSQGTNTSQPSSGTQTGSTATSSTTAGQVAHFDNAYIYFDFDEYNLTQSAIEKLKKKAEWLRNHPEAALLIEGHCDERGTNEYNLALGERRADAAEKYLKALGISDSRISIVSYGEERPAVQDHNEQAWAQNRRDEFYLKR